jgi:DUF1009 family protein
MISRFLPDDFNPEQSIAVIAGKGIYPEITVASIRKAGLSVKLIGFEEETKPELIESFSPDDRKIIKIGQLGKMLKTLTAFEVGYAIMAGQVTPKKLFKGLHPDLKTATILLKLKRKNAETIFGAIASEIENIGVQQLDARSFIDDQLADNGPMTRTAKTAEQSYLEHGIEIAREIARLDIGQGVVVRKGTVLAVEAFEGTDPMLQRAGTFKADQMIFVKTVKARQDYRFDVPVFGLRTLEVMKECSIQTAALEAGNTIILDKEAVIAQANAWKMEILGFAPSIAKK